MVARTLSPKQLRFIEEYLVDGNVTAAAKRAGYSPKSARVVGQETLRNPAVRAALEARQAAEAERLGVTRARVVASLLEAFEVAKRMSDPAGMVRACSELARLFNLYAVPKPVVEVAAAPSDMENRMMRMTDVELMKLVEGGAAPAVSAG